MRPWCHPLLQAERDAVAAELAEARSRYSWALAELEAERARSSMLESRANEAAAELAGVKERYREVCWRARALAALCRDGWFCCTLAISAMLREPQAAVSLHPCSSGVLPHVGWNVPP